MHRRPLSLRLLLGSGLLFAGAAGCLISFKVIGSHLDKDGTLREPFFLLPTSAVLLLGSSGSLMAAGVARLKQGR